MAFRTLSRAALGVLAGVAAVAALGPPAHAVTVAGVPPTVVLAAQCQRPATTVVAGVPWAQRRLAPSTVWHLSRGEGVIVAVVDTGVDARVPQLRGRVLSGRTVATASGRANDDCAGHGTFAAGVIAAQPVTGVGFVGVAPGARILPIRLDDGLGSDASQRAEAVAQGVRSAVDGGASVVAVSVEGFSSSPKLATAIGYAAARDVLVVVPAGRAEPDTTPMDATTAAAIVTVGAVNAEGSAWSAGRNDGGVDVVAPGVDVLSLGRGGSGHLVGSGDAVAVPFVAGVAALVRAYHPTLTASQVKARLLDTADRPGARVPDQYLGWGTINPYAAVAVVIPAVSPSPGSGVTASTRVRTPAAAAPDGNRAAIAATAVLIIVAVVTTAVLLTIWVLRTGRRRRTAPHDT